jgi:glutamate/tyrosine decarboxylase-like PLP-dependent enzyme
MHIDAAYAGSAFVCPEYRKYMKGIQVNLRGILTIAFPVKKTSRVQNLKQQLLFYQIINCRNLD